MHASAPLLQTHQPQSRSVSYVHALKHCLFFRDKHLAHATPADEVSNHWRVEQHRRHQGHGVDAREVAPEIWQELHIRRACMQYSSGSGKAPILVKAQPGMQHQTPPHLMTRRLQTITCKTHLLGTSRAGDSRTRIVGLGTGAWCPHSPPPLCRTRPPELAAAACPATP